MKPISLYSKRDMQGQKYKQISLSTLPTFQPQNINKNARIMRSPTEYNYYKQTDLTHNSDRFKMADRYAAIGAMQKQLNMIKQEATRFKSPLGNYSSTDPNSLSKHKSERSLTKPQYIKQAYTQLNGLKTADNKNGLNFLAWNKEKQIKFSSKQNLTPAEESHEKDRSIKNMKNIRNQIINSNTPHSRVQYQVYGNGQNNQLRELNNKQNKQLIQLNQKANLLTWENKKLKQQLQIEVSLHKSNKMRIQEYQNKVQRLQNVCKNYQKDQKLLILTMNDKNSKLKQQVNTLQQMAGVKDLQILQLQRKIKQLNTELKNEAQNHILKLKQKQSQRKALQQSLYIKQITINTKQSYNSSFQQKIQELKRNVKDRQEQLIQIQNKFNKQLILCQEISQKLCVSSKQLEKGNQIQSDLSNRLDQMTIRANQLQDELRLRSPILYKNCSQSPIKEKLEQQTGMLSQKVKKLEIEAKIDKKAIKSMKKQMELMRFDLQYLQQLKATASYLHLLNQQLNQRLIMTHAAHLNSKYIHLMDSQQTGIFQN